MDIIVTSKAGMTPFAHADSAEEALQLSTEAQQIGLSGDIIVDAPMPSDNWYRADELGEDHPRWGTAPASRFHLLDDGRQEGPCWFPERLDD